MMQDEGNAQGPPEDANPYPRGQILRKVLTFLVDQDSERSARRFQLWRVCHKSQCRRARACRGDVLECCNRFVDWAEHLVAADKDVDMSRIYRALMRQLGDRPA